MSDEYAAFIASKRIAAVSTGIVDVPDVGDYLFPFQADLVRWSLRRGRAAIFADTGLGKTIMMCEWASHIVDHVTECGEGDSVLILAPLAVADQTVKEAAKFGIDVRYCRAQADVTPGITIANYDMLGAFDPRAFAGIVLERNRRARGRRLPFSMLSGDP